MYSEEHIHHPLIYLVWRAELEPNDSVATAHANKRWGFVFKHSEGEPVEVLVIGPATAHYNFKNINKRCTIWGVELHEFVWSESIDKASLQGTCQEIAQIDGALKIGDVSPQIPDYDSLTSFVEKLRAAGVLQIDEKAKGVLTEQLVLSARSYQRVIRRVTGLSLKQIRMLDTAEDAIIMIENQSSLADVAHLLGYSDQSHLTNSLRRITAKTPAKFRKSNLL